MSAVDVDFDAKTATVTVRQGAELSREACQAELEKAGYTLESFNPA